MREGGAAPGESKNDAEARPSSSVLARACSLASGLHSRLLLLALVGAAPGLALLLHAVALHRRGLERDVRDHVVNVASLTSEALRERFESARGLLTALAEDLPVQDLDGPACSRLFASILVKFPAYANIGAIAPDGRLFCSALPTPPVDLSTREYFRRAVASRGIVLGEYAIGLVAKRPVLHVAYPSIDGSGTLRAVVYVALDLGAFTQAIDATPVPPGFVATVWSRSGTILARSPDPQREAGKTVAGPIAEALRSGLRGVTELPGADGVARIYAFAPLSGYADRVVVSAGIARSAAFAETERLVARFVAAYVAVIVVALGIGAVIAETTIARRVRRLSAAARSVSEGTLDARSGVPHARDEIGRLAKTFDEMTAAVGFLTRQNRLLLQSAGTGIFGLDLEERVTFVNPAACAMLGYAAEELLGRKLHGVIHARHLDDDPLADEDCPVLRMLRDGDAAHPVETVYWKKDGKPIPVESVARAIRERGETVGGVVTFRDVSDRKELQRQLMHAQKMEAVGRLASGVAHDFNNLLTIMLSIGNFLADELPHDHELAPEARELVAAARRGAALTRQLLAFSRKEMLEPTVVAVDDLVGSLERMVQRVIGEDVRLCVALDAKGACVRADPGHLEQALLNLVVNARDAMPHGGVLTIETHAMDIEGDTIGARLRIPRGPCVVVAVSDTGVGMDEATQAHLFEPFFTTKSRGTGTGLGLSTVYGIVKRSGGDIHVYSAPGKGSTFRLFLPSVSAAPASGAQPARQEAPARSAAVLVVDDDAAVRAVIARALRAGGHRVTEVGSGDEALAAIEGGAHDCDLLLTDVVMPGMSGIDLAARVRAARPDMRVLFMSGHTASILVEQHLVRSTTAYLPKPFAPRELLAKVAQALSDCAVA